MSKPSFTPGPWSMQEAQPAEFGRPHFYYINAKESIVASTWSVPPCATPLCEANARLIAAAPEMLQALKDVLNSDMAMREEDEGRKSVLLGIVRRAVAKAEGKI